jgi:dihydrofolate reductase
MCDSTKKPVAIIVAYDVNRGIGFGRQLPWHLPEELRWVSETTRRIAQSGKRNALVMGRSTWESIPFHLRPLKDRLNVVISTTLPLVCTEWSVVCRSFEDAMALVSSDASVETVFIFGGASIYAKALSENVVSSVIATEIRTAFPADTYFPPLPVQFYLEKVEAISCGGLECRRCYYRGGSKRERF